MKQTENRLGSLWSRAVKGLLSEHGPWQYGLALQQGRLLS